MSEPLSEFDELQVTLGRLRALLENLVVRGLRACGPDDLAPLKSFAEHLERAAAGHVAAVLTELHQQIETDDRAAARTLIKAQTAVRLLERLLTLRVVRGNYAAAIDALEHGAGEVPDEGDAIDRDDADDDEE